MAKLYGSRIAEAFPELGRKGIGKGLRESGVSLQTGTEGCYATKLRLLEHTEKTHTRRFIRGETRFNKRRAECLQRYNEDTYGS